MALGPSLGRPIGMREVEMIEIPAGKPMNLGENGYHLMLIGLSAPLKAGDMFPMMLSFKMANGHIEKINTMIKVKPLTESKHPSHDNGAMHMPM